MASQSFDLKELQEIENEVAQTIEERSQHWRILQDRLTSVFREYENRSPLSGTIYRVYTREDKQSPYQTVNPHLKAPHKIAEEIYVNRNGVPKKRGGRYIGIEATTDFDIFEVSDIIGITIVCPFPSDVERIVSHIEADIVLGRFSSPRSKKEHKRLDYEAVHFYLGYDEEPLGMLVCEVQVKTAFQDAFGWKTHGLTYKPSAEADEWFVDQLNRINVVIRTADEMSDQLREKITRKTVHGNERREQAKASLKENLLKQVRNEPDEVRRVAILSIVEALEQCRDPKATNRVATLNQLRTEVERLLSSHGNDRVTFRVAALYAIDCGRTDQLYWLGQRYKAWIRKLDPNKDAESAEAFYQASVTCGIAHYCVGDLKGAIRVGQTALESFKATPDAPGDNLARRLASNVAYFLAEQFSLTPTEEFATLSRQLMDRAINGDDIPLPMKDTLGFVLIQTGTTIEEVERGIGLCRESHQAICDLSPAQAETSSQFFELHREIGYQRLAELTRSTLSYKAAGLSTSN